MTSKKNIFVSILLFFLVINSTNAQQQTAYQKKTLEIQKKYVKKILIGEGKWTQRSEAELFYANSEYLNAVLAIGLMGTPQYIEGFKNEMKQAEKLKTSSDFQREKEEKLNNEKKKNEIEQHKKDEAFERTDVAIIKKNIKTSFEKWNQKGEFEKQTEYEIRIQDQSQNSFEEICIEQIKSKISNKDYYLNMELLPYDADNEFFNVKFKINNLEWLSKINIPITNAEKFKNNWSNLQRTVNNYDWCFVENTLCPTIITLSDENNKYQFTLSLQNQKEIIYHFEDLSIENKFLKNYIFNFNDARKIEIKIAQDKLVKDSILIKSFNDKLETSFQNLNNKLLNNKYNIDKKVILDYDKITNNEVENAEDNYNESMELLTRNYNSINSKFKIAFDTAYNKVNQLFETKEEFEKYYVLGKDDLFKEIEKRKEKEEEEKIIDYFNFNLILIESMDFKPSDPSKDFTNENKIRKNILSMINESKKKSYYSRILDFIFEKNKDLNKKWNKDAEYFSNKVELYEAYITGNYKQILKEKK